MIGQLNVTDGAPAHPSEVPTSVTPMASPGPTPMVLDSSTGYEPNVAAPGTSDGSDGNQARKRRFQGHQYLSATDRPPLPPPADAIPVHPLTPRGAWVPEVSPRGGSSDTADPRDTRHLSVSFYRSGLRELAIEQVTWERNLATSESEVGAAAQSSADVVANLSGSGRANPIMIQEGRLMAELKEQQARQVLNDASIGLSYVVNSMNWKNTSVTK